VGFCSSFSGIPSRPDDVFPGISGILVGRRIVSAAFFRPLLREPRTEHTLRNTRSGRVLANRLIPAFDSESRRTGLLKHEALPDGSAMVIAPTNAVHTFFMRFAIDIAFIARDGRVVKTCAAVKPWRIAAAWRAYGVIELPPGTLARCDTVAGDLLVIGLPEQV
jgi:uncharacterized membrane protein (UPF0127 family)